MSPGVRLTCRRAGWPRLSALLILSAGLLVGAPQTAHACSCASRRRRSNPTQPTSWPSARSTGRMRSAPTSSPDIRMVPTVAYKVQCGQRVQRRAGSAKKCRCRRLVRSVLWMGVDREGREVLVFARRTRGTETQLRGEQLRRHQAGSASATAELIALAGEPRAPDKSIPKPNDPDQSVFLLAARPTPSDWPRGPVPPGPTIRVVTPAADTTTIPRLASKC